MSLERFFKVSVPLQVQDDVALASFAMVEAYVVLDAYSVKHIGQS